LISQTAIAVISVHLRGVLGRQFSIPVHLDATVYCDLNAHEKIEDEYLAAAANLGSRHSLQFLSRDPSWV
jgi:hypothetical protein